MKKNVIIGLILGFCLMPLSVKAAFEGEITFQVAFTGGDAKSKAQSGMMMPSSYDLLIKGNQLKANMHGGIMSLMMGEIIIDGESGRAFAISSMQRTAYEMTADLSLKGQSKPVIIDEEETSVIAGYTCKKYKVIQTKADGQVIQYMWITDEIQLGNMDSFEGPLKDSMPFLIEGITGFPLKIVTTLPGVSMVMTLSANKVSPGSIDPSMFAVPAGYDIKPFDPSTMFGN